MSQKKAWEDEYRRGVLISRSNQPQNFLIQSLKYLKKEHRFITKNLKVLDLGCGTGRNSNYLAGRGNQVVGIDIAENALRIGREQAKKLKVDSQVDYINQSIGQLWPLNDNYFDLVLDITSSNSLNEKERAVYLKELARVLKPEGFFILRALCKDGDKNAQNLLRLSPGKETDTYFLKELNLIERVFSEVDLRDYYKKHFHFCRLKKDKGYQKIKGVPYQRKYWIGILKTLDFN